MKIGLTGGVAAGKSEALSALARIGAATISADAIVHDLLDREPMLSVLSERWGPDVVVDGGVDRAAVGDRVFNDPAELAWLEAKVHPLVRRDLTDWFAGLPEGTEVAVVEVPLLFEGEMEQSFDFTIAIVADESVRRERARARGHVGIEGREARQLSQAEKSSRATHVVENDGTPDELQSRLARLLSGLGVEASQKGP